MEFQEIVEKYEKRIEDLKKELDYYKTWVEQVEELQSEINYYKIWVEHLQDEIDEYRSLN